LKVYQVKLSKVLSGQFAVTAGMALRLSVWFGKLPDV
jgi:plasmid maintenance system antidote protein VapI